MSQQGGIIATFTDRREWLQARRHSVGASDAPTLFNEGYAGETVYTLYLDKLGELPDRDERESEFLEVGSFMQPAILSLARHRFGLSIVDEPEHQIRQHPDLPWITASLDAEVAEPSRDLLRPGIEIPEFVSGPGVVEVKYPGTYQAPHWRDGAPLKHQIQVQQQMAVTSYGWGLVLGLLGHSLKAHFVRRHDEFIATLLDVDSEFWGRVCDRDPPPIDGSEATRKAILRMHPNDNGYAVALPVEFERVHADLEAIKRQQKDIEAERDRLENILRDSIGDASYGILPDGSYYSFHKQSRAGHWVNGSEYRVLRHSTKRRVFKLLKEAS